MASRTNDTRLASTTAFAFVALLATVALILPSAAATGYLVNADTWVVTVQHGTNAFGGAGDTIDIGWGNYQCTDEDDVVDVGIQNREGDAACGWRTEEGCHAEEGGGTTVGSEPLGIEFTFDRLVPIGDIVVPIFTPAKERPTHCSDDGDTVDVGLFNDEGGAYEWGAYPYECYQAAQESGEGGDEGDAVDVGVFNRECGDDRDANDIGLFNCETLDRSDGIDLGVGNLEWEDQDDTFDLAIGNAEWGDGPDGNGWNILPYFLGGGEFCFLHLPGPR